MLKNYLKIAFQVLLRRKFFTFISLFGVSLTLVVLMVATAVLDEMAGPRPPEVHADRTLGVYEVMLRGGNRTSDSNAAYWFLDRYVRTLPEVEKVTVFASGSTVAAYRDGEKIALELKRTDAAFWQVYSFEFLEGGPFTEEDDARAERLAVINETTRKRLYDGATAVGRKLEIDGLRFRVVGVVADVSSLRKDPFADVWAPISTAKSDLYRRQALIGDFAAVILARDRGDFPAIKRAFRARLAEVELPEPFEEIYSSADTRFETLSRQLTSGQQHEDVGPWRMRLAIVLGMILFMVLPSLNLININVSRILERSSEIGVRKAFGASSWTLVGQFVVENVLLTLIGGAFAFVLSGLVLEGLTNASLIPYASFQLNHRIFLWGLAIALVFGLISGVYPAWKMSRLHPVTALRRRSL